MKIITLLVQYSHKQNILNSVLIRTFHECELDYLYEDSYTFQALFEYLDLYSDKIPDEKGIL